MRRATGDECSTVVLRLCGRCLCATATAYSRIAAAFSLGDPVRLFPAAVLFRWPLQSIHPLTRALTGFQPRTALSPAELVRLSTALAKCYFDITKPDGRRVFDSFCQLLIRLSENERDLVLTLLEDFLHCTYFDTLPRVAEALDAIPVALTSQVEHVILLPLAETRHDGKPKSPSALLYPTENLLLPDVQSFSGKSSSVYERMVLLKTKAARRPRSLIILLDDFVGSGESAVKAIKRYRADFQKPSDRLVVVAAAAQQQGIDLIANEKVGTYAAIVRTKGISESEVITDRPAALAIMDNLEMRLGVHPDYLRGYRQCEALVKMTRTPNNTLPIFWHPTTATGDEWPAPFRRFA